MSKDLKKRCCAGAEEGVAIRIWLTGKGTPEQIGKPKIDHGSSKNGGVLSAPKGKDYDIHHKCDNNQCQVITT